MTLGGIARPYLRYARKQGLNIRRKKKRILIDQDFLVDNIHVEPEGRIYILTGILHIGKFSEPVGTRMDYQVNIKELADNVQLEGRLSKYEDYLRVPTVAIGFYHGNRFENVVLQKGSHPKPYEKVYSQLVQIVRKELL